MPHVNTHTIYIFFSLFINDDLVSPFIRSLTCTRQHQKSKVWCFTASEKSKKKAIETKKKQSILLFRVCVYIYIVGQRIVFFAACLYRWGNNKIKYIILYIYIIMLWNMKIFSSIEEIKIYKFIDIYLSDESFPRKQCLNYPKDWK